MKDDFYAHLETVIMFQQRLKYRHFESSDLLNTALREESTDEQILILGENTLESDCMYCNIASK